MKIIEQNSNKLTLHSRALGSWILGSLIAPIGILIPLLFAGKTIHLFNCDRTSTNEGSCKIQEIHRWGKKTPTVILINKLKGARLDTRVTYDKKRKKHTIYKVYILTKQKNIYFIENSKRQYLESIVNQINEFLKNKTQPNLRIRSVSDNFVLMYIIGGILESCSIALLRADDTICSFDKKSGNFYIKKRGIRGKRFQVERNMNISDVRIEESNRWEDKKTGKITYKLSLVLKSGESLFLHSGSSIEHYMNIDDNIRKIINI
ncbi:hypothetical protein [Nostoc sp. FACHB-280]|uniref:hypothetical protein n=1 Tax=Nostoc sp. FACHB-280 TaxID=2692839 RepID=UPI00168AC5C2|nr:hypothetical protein [Nostoc sp. FACHB-280]MBD2496332.1 hypothetical protein [Nostoc sp. FACHB-280]